DFFYFNRKSIRAAIKSAKELKGTVEEKKIEIIHVQTGPAFIPLLFIQIKTPTILTIGGSDLLGYHSKNILWKVRGKLAGLVTLISSFKANKIICVSNNLKKRLPAFIKKKTIILPRGINTDFFRPFSLEKAREVLNWEMDR